MKKYSRFDSIKYALNRAEAFLEISILGFLYYFVWEHFYAGKYVNPYYYRGRILIVLLYVFILIILLALTDGLKFGYRKFSGIIISQWVSLTICNVVSYFQIGLIYGNLVAVRWFLLLLLTDYVISFFSVLLFTSFYHRFYVPRRMLMVYSDIEKANNLKSKIETRSDKYKIESMISLRDGLDVVIQELGNYDAVVIDAIPDAVRNDLLMYCFSNNISIYVVPEIPDIFIRGSMSIDLFDTPLIHPKREMTFFQRISKRSFDIVISSVALVLLSPLFLIISLLIKIEDGGPVFYKQVRLTKGGKRFNVLKFRSMKTNAEKDGVARLASRDDDRITHIGRIIRACRMDEVPQFLNILKGDMSIVGPRPERPEIAEQYISQGIPYNLRLKVKAGLTGYAQIIGKYNTTAEDKLRLDLMYIENYSFLLDMKMLFMTLRVIFQKESTEGV